MFEPTNEKLTAMVDQPQEELPQLISIAWLMPYTFISHSFPLLITLGLLFGDLFAPSRRLEKRTITCGRIYI